VFTDRPGTLTNDFFVNLLDMHRVEPPSNDEPGVFVGHDRASGETKWTGTAVDLIFGSNSQLRGPRSRRGLRRHGPTARRSFVD
jgi:catalase-peroxidase